jgi:predicted RNA-binding Zn ribbon-like protein
MVMQQPVHDLPERLALPLETGEPWWYWLGGRPALDLVNTLRERWRRRVETLVTPADLGLWLERSGVVAEPGPAAVTPTVLEEARALREAIDACVTALVDGGPSPREAVELVDSWLVHAGARPQLALDPAGVPALGERAEGDSPRRGLGAIALDAAPMLGDPAERARVRVCASDTCSARFYDRSPAGRRRWCSMRTCGNEAKARRHRARSRSGA